MTAADACTVPCARHYSMHICSFNYHHSPVSWGIWWAETWTEHVHAHKMAGLELKARQSGSTITEPGCHAKRLSKLSLTLFCYSSLEGIPSKDVKSSSKEVATSLVFASAQSTNTKQWGLTIWCAHTPSGGWGKAWSPDWKEGQVSKKPGSLCDQTLFIPGKTNKRSSIATPFKHRTLRKRVSENFRLTHLLCELKAPLWQ